MQCLKQIHSEESCCHLTELGKTRPCMLIENITTVTIGLGYKLKQIIAVKGKKKQSFDNN